MQNSSSSSGSSGPQAPTKHCGGCGATKCGDESPLKTCRFCHAQLYCSRDCQLRHLHVHEKVCVGTQEAITNYIEAVPEGDVAQAARSRDSDANVARDNKRGVEHITDAEMAVREGPSPGESRRIEFPSGPSMAHAARKRRLAEGHKLDSRSPFIGEGTRRTGSFLNTIPTWKQCAKWGISDISYATAKAEFRYRRVLETTGRAAGAGVEEGY